VADPAAPRAAGLLLDIDGTVYKDGRLIPGAAAALAWLGERGVPHLFTTNTTRKPRAAIVARLTELGLTVGEEQCLTAPMAGAAWLRRQGARRILPLLTGATLVEFTGFEVDEETPEVVVVGDLGERWSAARLDRAFRALMGGAELLALQRNRYWRRRGELCLDAGAFVKALEHASGKTAHLAGKPSKAFFTAAVEQLGVPADGVAVVGDDAETDLRGARGAGLTAVGVRTGKYRPEDEERLSRAADAVLDSVADLPAWLEGGGWRAVRSEA
jgi:HAD superfamily hydrolase (TIGR01458 family)